MALSGQKCLHSGKVVIFGQKWLYLGKSDCIPAKVVVLEQKWLYSGKLVLFGQKWLLLGKIGSILAK